MTSGSGFFLLCGNTDESGYISPTEAGFEPKLVVHSESSESASILVRFL